MLLKRFADVFGELFPAIDSETRTHFAKAIRERRLIAKELYADTKPEGLCQGDICKDIPVRIQEADGDWYERTGPVLILANTCDASNDEHLLLAPCSSFEEFKADPMVGSKQSFLSSIRTNEVSDLFFLPNVPGVGDLVAELGAGASVSRPWLETAIASNPANRLSAFSQLGYYLFLAKLTVHFLRPETGEVQRSNAGIRFGDRFREAVEIMFRRRG